MRKVKLTQGKFALVDDAEYEAVAAFRWQFGTDGYAIRTEGSGASKRTVIMHRQIMKAKPHLQIDHINRVKLDNQKCNLRAVTKSINSHNRTYYQNATSYRGVRAWGDAFHARISFNKKRYFLGSFPTAKEAALAYDRRALKLYGPHACVNFPNRSGVTEKKDRA